MLLEEVDGSFSLALRRSSWLPSSCRSMTVETLDNSVVSSSQLSVLPGGQVYRGGGEVESLLAHTVSYLSVTLDTGGDFLKFLKVVSRVSVDSVRDAVISWSCRDLDSPDTPRSFCTSSSHLARLYNYLTEKLSKKESQDLFHNHPVIFVPNDETFGKSSNPVAGKMLFRQELWWADPTELFIKYSESIKKKNSPLSKYRVVGHLYRALHEMFHFTVRVPLGPNITHLAQLVKHLAATTQPASSLSDVLHLFSEMGSHLSKIDHSSAGVATLEAQTAAKHLPEVRQIFTDFAVWPTVQGGWVPLSDCPMLVDSEQLEKLFASKSGVNLLSLKFEDNSGLSGKVPRKDCLDYFVGLFKESIKPLSECVSSRETISGFSPCPHGQNYMHQVAGLLQRFLYFGFPKVYKKFVEREAKSLKSLQFVEVRQLEVKYWLKNQPDVFEVCSEKSLQRDKYFYFHADIVASRFEMNMEIAKYFSGGNKECFRELKSFLSQVLPILEKTSDETIESLMSRQKCHIGNLPASEKVWEVPSTGIDEVEPMSVEDEKPDMVYSPSLHWADDNRVRNESRNNDNNEDLSWPPNSGAFHSRKKRDNSQRNFRNFRRNDNKPRFEDRFQGNNDRDNFASTQNYNQGFNENLNEGTWAQPQNVGARAEEFDRGQGWSREEHRDFGNERKRGHPDDPANEAIKHQRFDQDYNQAGPSGFHDAEEDVRVVEPTSSHRWSPGLHQGQGDGQDWNQGQQSRGEGHWGTDSLLPLGNPARLNPHEMRDFNVFGNAPIWRARSAEIPFTPLGHGANLSVPNFSVTDDSQAGQIGRWGECLVSDFLRNEKQQDPSILEVRWPNAIEETGRPYDFEIVYRNTDRRSYNPGYSVFIEVKTTVSWEKTVFPASIQELQFALAHKEHYQIYRVFGAGSTNVKLIRIENIAERIRLQEMKLLMHL